MDKKFKTVFKISKTDVKKKSLNNRKFWLTNGDGLYFKRKNKFKEIFTIYNNPNKKLKNKINCKTEKNKKIIYNDIYNIKNKINNLKLENKNLSINKLKNINISNKNYRVKKKINNNDKFDIWELNKKVNFIKELNNKNIENKSKIYYYLKNTDKREIINNNMKKIQFIKNFYIKIFYKINLKISNVNKFKYNLINKNIINIDQYLIKYTPKLLSSNEKISFFRANIKKLIKDNTMLKIIKNEDKNQLKKMTIKQDSILVDESNKIINNLEKEKLILSSKILDKDSELINFDNKIDEIKKELLNKLNKVRWDNNKIKKKIKTIIMRNKKNSQKNINNDYKILKYNLINKEKNNIKILKKVEYDDIKDIIKQLKIKFFIKGFNIDYILLLFLKNNSKNIKIYELIQRLSKKPFKIKVYDDCIKLSRFLIEDNEKEFIEYNKNNNNSVSIVKSIIKNLFYSMEFPIKLNFDKIHNKLSLIFQKEYDRFAMHKNLLEKGGALIDIRDFINFYKKQNHKLSIKEVNYLEISLYFLFNKTEKINFSELKNLFMPTNSNLNNIFNKKQRKYNKDKLKINFTKTNIYSSEFNKVKKIKNTLYKLNSDDSEDNILIHI